MSKLDAVPEQMSLPFDSNEICDAPRRVIVSNVIPFSASVSGSKDLVPQQSTHLNQTSKNEAEILKRVLSQAERLGW